MSSLLEREGRGGGSGMNMKKKEKKKDGRGRITSPWRCATTERAFSNNHNVKPGVALHKRNLFLHRGFRLILVILD